MPKAAKKKVVQSSSHPRILSRMESDTEYRYMGYTSLSSARRAFRTIRCTRSALQPKYREWVKNRFREYDARMHEWIPCELLDRIAQMDLNQHTRGLWATLQHRLRTSTKFLIFKPSTNVTETINRSRHCVLSGHPGAVTIVATTQLRKGKDKLQSTMR